MSLTQYQNLADSLGLGQNGYAFILSQKGAFVSHPDSNLVTENKTMVEWAREQGDTKLENLGAGAVHGIRGFTEREDRTSGRVEWVFTEPIVSAGWSVGLVFFKDTLIDFAPLQNLLVGTIAAGILALIFIGLAMIFRRRLNTA